MSITAAYQLVYRIVLVWFGFLLFVMLVRSVIGPRITDRILSINMIGTMVICCICILSCYLQEDFLMDVALLYAMVSFLAVLILAAVYIPASARRGKFASDTRGELREEKERKTSGGETEMSSAADENPSVNE